MTASDNAADLAPAISVNTSATVVQVNYRLSKEHKYPTCIHDVLQAYDWILEHLVPGRAFQRPGRSAWHSTPIAACGELIGGGLATMLALTESRLTGPRVSAAAVNEPVCDWLFPEETIDEDEDDMFDLVGNHSMKRKSRSKRKKIVPSFHAFGNNGTIDASALLDARAAYFHKPADYFDPFASPVLFFRNAGVEIPPAPANITMDEFEELAKYERDDFHRQQLKLGSIGIMPGLTGNQPVTEQPTPAAKVARKTHKRWPTIASGLSIPSMRISFGNASPLSDQAAELGILLRRSVISQMKKDASSEEEVEQQRQEAFMYAEQKAELHELRGIQYWTDTNHSEEVRRMSQWLRQTLD